MNLLPPRICIRRLTGKLIWAWNIKFNLLINLGLRPHSRRELHTYSRTLHRASINLPIKLTEDTVYTDLYASLQKDEDQMSDFSFVLSNNMFFVGKLRKFKKIYIREENQDFWVGSRMKVVHFVHSNNAFQFNLQILAYKLTPRSSDCGHSRCGSIQARTTLTCNKALIRQWKGNFRQNYHCHDSR